LNCILLNARFTIYRHKIQKAKCFLFALLSLLFQLFIGYFYATYVIYSVKNTTNRIFCDNCKLYEGLPSPYCKVDALITKPAILFETSNKFCDIYTTCHMLNFVKIFNKTS